MAEEKEPRSTMVCGEVNSLDQVELNKFSVYIV